MNNRIYELRIKRGMTLKQLAKKSGIGKTTINNFENGKSNATLETVICLADALGVSINEVFEEKKPKSITVKKSDYPNKTKEEYIAELHEVLSETGTSNVRQFYIFIMVKLGIQPKNCSMAKIMADTQGGTHFQSTYDAMAI